MRIPKTKTVYSFRIHTKLMLMGFKPLLEMDNPKKTEFKCWVYEASPAFFEAFDLIMKEVKANGK
jgi:hypothetical protein